MNDSKGGKLFERLNIEPVESLPNSKLGIALETLGKQPINGLRHPDKNDTCRWYIWCGEERSDMPDFFSPIHVSHVPIYLPLVKEYLALPPGYRFLIDDNGFEDVWFDNELLSVS